MISMLIEQHEQDFITGDLIAKFENVTRLLPGVFFHTRIQLPDGGISVISDDPRDNQQMPEKAEILRHYSEGEIFFGTFRYPFGGMQRATSYTHSHSERAEACNTEAHSGIPTLVEYYDRGPVDSI